MATTWQGVQTTIYRALADGDLVVLHPEYKNLLNRHETAVAFDLPESNQGAALNDSYANAPAGWG